MTPNKSCKLENTTIMATITMRTCRGHRDDLATATSMGGLEHWRVVVHTYREEGIVGREVRHGRWGASLLVLVLRCYTPKTKQHNYY